METMRAPAPVRLDTFDWREIESDLTAYGCAIVKSVLPPGECIALRELYPSDDAFRSRIVMARHGFGKGEYKYFRYPLPATVAELREGLYPQLAAIANRW